MIVPLPRPCLGSETLEALIKSSNIKGFGFVKERSDFGHKFRFGCVKRRWFSFLSFFGFTKDHLLPNDYYLEIRLNLDSMYSQITILFSEARYIRVSYGVSGGDLGSYRVWKTSKRLEIDDLEFTGKKTKDVFRHFIQRFSDNLRLLSHGPYR